MSAFDTLVAQEEEFIKIQVGKIIRLAPDVVVVEKTVSRLAQALLLEANITLLLNVKRSVLEKLSRFTQTSILFSTDFAAHFEDRLGSCLSFRTETIKLQGEKAERIGAGRKPESTLVYFQGHTSLNKNLSSTALAPSLYCTIVLRGAHQELLKKIKRVLSRVIELAHSLALQCAFQDDSCSTFPDQLVTKELATYTRDIAQAHTMEPPTITCINILLLKSAFDSKSVRHSQLTIYHSPTAEEVSRAKASSTRPEAPCAHAGRGLSFYEEGEQ